MHTDTPAYGLWSLVVINSAVFIIFAFSFTHPRSARDWRSFGAFAAFLVALFTEMYGVPLTLYLLAGWLGQKYPDSISCPMMPGISGETLLGWQGDLHWHPIHIVSNVLIGGGFVVLAAAWRVLYAAQRTHTLAVTGPYASVRHPQYVGFVLIMVGFLVQWPTLLTLLMFPILVIMYVRLARREEREVRDAFGAAYTRYAAETPAFFPHLGRLFGGQHEEDTIWSTRSAMLLLLGSLLLSGLPKQDQPATGHPQRITLYVDGPQPQVPGRSRGDRERDHAAAARAGRTPWYPIVAERWSEHSRMSMRSIYAVLPH